MVWPFDKDYPWHSLAKSDQPLPRISVITASFNQGQFIETTIRSVLAQGYPNLQYIVVDNCSSDGTGEVLEFYKDRIDQLIIEPDTGQSNALNKGFNIADGEILTWINSDDMLAPGALFQVAAAYGIVDHPDLIAGSLLYMNNDEIMHEHVSSVRSGRLSPEDLIDVHNQWMQGKFFYQPEVFFTKSAFERVGGYLDESLYYSMDYDFWVRLALAGATIKVIGAPLAIFRAHPEQKTSSPEKYTPELLHHANALSLKHGLPAPKPKADGFRQLRLLFVADVPNGGASVAHSRLQRIAADAGHATAMSYLSPKLAANQPGVDVLNIYHTISEFNPDLVIVGNLHGVGNATSILEMISINFSCVYYTHDMWLITGRCVYNQGCNKFHTLCDQRCPTANEYPSADPYMISSLHRSKIKLQSLTNFRVLANSGWMENNIRLVWNDHQLAAAEPGKLSIVTPPCDVHRFLTLDRAVARDKLLIPRDADVIVCSAHNFTESRKGYLYIVDAVQALSALGHQPIVLFAGVADEETRLKLELFGNCSFLGFVMPEAMELVYGAADVLLSAALDEAFGMAYVEAAAAGAQSVAFRSGGIEDAVCDGVSGVLVDSLTGEALANAIAGLLARKREGESLSVAPRMWAVANHSDIAVLRRFQLALAEDGLLHAIAAARSQLYRRTTLEELFGPARAPAESLGQLCAVRQTYVEGMGLIEYVISADGADPEYLVARFRFAGERRISMSETRGPFSWDFKLIQRCGTLFMDLRPHECSPPIYQLAPVGRGRPFISDEWGPTLFAKVGDLEEMDEVEAKLPRTEFNNFCSFVASLSGALQNDSIAANVGAALTLAGFADPLDKVVEKLGQWRRSDRLTEITATPGG